MIAIPVANGGNVKRRASAPRENRGICELANRRRVPIKPPPRDHPVRFPWRGKIAHQTRLRPCR